ncbi:MAG TPA: pyridoxamine 5'-phosphate oxidase family protein [Telluria sp.]|nr:pyridoxamine 5'-phosphate oxidase family protein [Telluria sp.]
MSPSDRTRVKRAPDRAHYDSATLHAVIDAAYLCHVAFADDNGVHNIPMACWREGNHLYIHGSNGSRMIRRLGGGAQACVTISHVDGLVLARSAFSHSMNYRSALVYGVFEKVEALEAKRASLEAFMHRLVPGRQADVRPGNDKEFAATTVLRIALDEAACKIRTGGPCDDPEDAELPHWAGVLPFQLRRAAPIAHEACDLPLPAYLRDWV